MVMIDSQRSRLMWQKQKHSMEMRLYGYAFYEQMMNVMYGPLLFIFFRQSFRHYYLVRRYDSRLMEETINMEAII